MNHVLDSPEPESASRSPVAGAGDRAHDPTVVGLIGGIGAGKSHLAAALARRGAVVIDADRVGHDLLLRPDVRRRVVEAFGPEIAPAGEIDRRRLGRIVFDDPARLRVLESILHPEMREAFAQRIEQAGRHGHRLVALDAAVLLEAGWDDLCDLVLFVEAPAEVRHDRLGRTRGWSPAEIARREAVQWPLDRKRERADLIWDPPQDRSSEDEQVDRLAKRLCPATAPVQP